MKIWNPTNFSCQELSTTVYSHGKISIIVSLSPLNFQALQNRDTSQAKLVKVLTKRSYIKAMSVVPQCWYHNEVFPVRFWRHRKLLKHDSINWLFWTTTWIHIVQLKHKIIFKVLLKYDLNLSLNNYIICM